MTARVNRPMTAIAIHARGVSAFPLGDVGTARRWVIGRAKDADIVIDDASVSRRHAVLHGGASFDLEDLGSENGTTLVLHAGGVQEETLRLVPRRLRQGSARRSDRWRTRSSVPSPS